MHHFCTSLPAHLELVLNLDILPLEAPILHHDMKFGERLVLEVDTFGFLLALETDQLWRMPWDVVHLEANVRISVAGLFDKFPHHRQLVQSSARASLDLAAIKRMLLSVSLLIIDD